MAWEWSHSGEAVQNAYENTHNLPVDTLLEILGEWQYHDQEQEEIEPSFDLPPHYRDLPQDVLADSVWEKAEALKTCTNGGHYAWLCPDGCHKVSFDNEEEGE